MKSRGKPKSRRRVPRKRIGFTAGSFDLCHAGHVMMFEDCLTVCDQLIVAVQEDPTVDRPQKNAPVMSLEERVRIVSALRPVDQVITYRTEADLLHLLRTVHFDVRILGSDWEGKPFTGHDLPHVFYFHNRNYPYSSSELRERVYEAEKKKRKRKS